MARYLISFPSDAMNHIPAEDLPAVGDAAGAVVQEALDAGVWVFGGGLAETVDPVVVATASGDVVCAGSPDCERVMGRFESAACEATNDEPAKMSAAVAAMIPAVRRPRRRA